MEKDLITPETDPNHHTVGHTFRFFGEVYFCESYDPATGYWMKHTNNSTDLRNVSERAINRTFHHFYSKCVHLNCKMPAG